MVNETGQPYAYTGDDPVNGVDPLGLQSLCGGGILGLIGSYIPETCLAQEAGLKRSAWGNVCTVSMPTRELIVIPRRLPRTSQPEYRMQGSRLLTV
jgi:hypothetical protein